jgi:hypothetical protein
MRATALAKAHEQVKPGVIEEQELLSPLLTRFSGNPTSIKAWVVLPPGYEKDASAHYPTVYYTHGFGGSLEYNLMQATMIRARMEAGTMPPMIWVMLDESCPQGTHEFADSVNNGPWGTALTTEFIPMLETKYRMDAKPTGRFLNGHSSGGWATLQLQINFPQVFGGTWSTSPDPSDFHNFTGPDLYAPHANVYRRPDGTAYPIMRIDGKVVATLEQFSKIEEVLGPYGGQITSFDWVFSPRSNSGAPKPMFDRVTGDVDPTVVAYWHDHYDLAHLVEEKWPTQSGSSQGPHPSLRRHRRHLLSRQFRPPLRRTPRKARRRRALHVHPRPYPHGPIRCRERPLRALRSDRNRDVCGRATRCHVEESELALHKIPALALSSLSASFESGQLRAR